MAKHSAKSKMVRNRLILIINDITVKHVECRRTKKNKKDTTTVKLSRKYLLGEKETL